MTDPGQQQPCAQAMHDRAKTEVARSALNSGQRSTAAKIAQEVGAAAPAHSPAALAAGILLFQVGAFASASEVLERCATAGTADREALSALAALRHRSGDLLGAQSALRQACHIAPYRRIDSVPKGKLPVLRVRAVHSSFLAIERTGDDGLFRRGLRRGHFSTRSLIDTKTFHDMVVSLAGNPLPDIRDVPAPRVIVNTAACADLNSEGLHEVGQYIAQWSGIPIINAPERVRATSRAGNALRLADIDGLHVPQTLTFRNHPDPAVSAGLLQAARLAPPVILRRAGSQTGISMGLVENEAALMARLAAEPHEAPMIATAFHDLRTGDGLYRKLRVFFIDGELFPVVDLRSDHWNIHSSDRYRTMVNDQSAKAQELAFLTEPAAILGSDRIKTLQAIADRIGLDFLGVDFCPSEEFGIVLFEANAAMRHNYEHLEHFPYRRPFLKNITTAFNAMLLRRAQL